MKQIAAHEVVIHGVEHEQYFQGCGVSFTPYTDVATGIGSDAREAFEDALESLAMAGWDVALVEATTELEECVLPEDAHEELHVYVSVRVR